MDIKEPKPSLSWHYKTCGELDAKDTADEAGPGEPRSEWTPYQRALRRVLVELIKYGRQKLRRSIN